MDWSAEKKKPICFDEHGNPLTLGQVMTLPRERAVSLMARTSQALGKSASARPVRGGRFITHDELLEWGKHYKPPQNVLIEVKDENGNRLLHHYDKAGRWDFPAGKIASGETPVEAATRELRTLTGYEVDPTDLEPAGQSSDFYRFTASAEKLRKVGVSQSDSRFDKLASAMPHPLAKPKRHVLKNNSFDQVDDDDVDLEFPEPAAYFGSHVNLIPLQGAVAGPRLFYGARFYNQALPVANPEAPLVQNLHPSDPDGRSFDEMLGEAAGALRAKNEGTVTKITPHEIHLEGPEGKKVLPIYHKYPFNRKTALHQEPLVKVGDKVTKGQLLAHSNFTDKQGALAMGLNARVGVVPYKGHTMDDAIVVSESFAKRLTSNHLYGHDLDYKRGVKGGKAHYTGIFANKFVNEQLDKLDDDGVVRVGQTVHPGDPIILATAPRVISSTNAQLGLLSKHMKNARTDAVKTWDEHTPGVVTDVQKLRNGVKVNIETSVPTEEGDKIVFRSGNKGTISMVIPDEHMPRTVDGQPLEVLLNPNGVPSRVNSSILYEIMLGKAAKRMGKPIKLPSFNQPGEQWHATVNRYLNAAGVNDTEEVFDPQLNRKLENPITVGDAYILKLHHTSASKMSARGQGAYSNDQIPLHGGGEQGQAKRLSGLETHSLLSSGAYHVLREGITLRGQKNDDYWRQLRMGYEPKEPGKPFVWDKFRALLNGSGYLAKHLPGGQHRLQFWSDKDLDKVRPVKVNTGDLVDLGTMEPVKGGLFDPAITGGNSWGYIDLPFPVPNPAAEDVIRKLLGLTENQFRDIMAGKAELPAHLQIQK